MKKIIIPLALCLYIILLQFDKIDQEELNSEASVFCAEEQLAVKEEAVVLPIPVALDCNKLANKDKSVD
ncbi:hypothetical protein [Aquimarina agarivorans]|uniref:hypothetical protein n=1 Tax=Aquimarina agarivorans TaxID=980584 RepID=UPI000248EDDA|nr:hypothetical protein [Aquimarina agarivorans]